MYLSEDSNVFDSHVAKDLLLILTACLNPFSERHILNAVATEIFAQTSADIQRIRLNETLWEHWVEKFIQYQKTWQKQGVLVMLQARLLLRHVVRSRLPNRLRAFQLDDTVGETPTLPQQLRPVDVAGKPLPARLRPFGRGLVEIGRAHV